MEKVNSFDDVKQKGWRLLKDGDVHLIRASSSFVHAFVAGDSDSYECWIKRKARVNNYTKNTPLDWYCDCQWGDWAFKRQVDYVGRMCSHVYALYLVMRSMFNRKNGAMMNKRARSNAVTVAIESFVDKFVEDNFDRFDTATTDQQKYDYLVNMALNRIQSYGYVTIDSEDGAHDTIQVTPEEINIAARLLYEREPEDYKISKVVADGGSVNEYDFSGMVESAIKGVWIRGPIKENVNNFIEEFGSWLPEMVEDFYDMNKDKYANEDLQQDDHVTGDLEDDLGWWEEMAYEDYNSIVEFSSGIIVPDGDNFYKLVQAYDSDKLEQALLGMKKDSSRHFTIAEQIALIDEDGFPQELGELLL